MRLLLRCVIVACVCLLAVTPAWAQNSGGLPGKEHTLAREAYERAERVVLLKDAAQGDVVHYQFDVPVGPGPFDVIRMHRVVKEVRPGRPAKKMEGILLLPGIPQKFEAIFLQAPLSGHPVGQSSVALYLALYDIDVWGMDCGHSFVPYPSTEFGFFRNWGVERDAADVQTALSIARWLRVTSEQGNDPMHLLGFSYGGLLVYAAAAEDTQRPGNLRNIKGLIPVDGTPIKVQPGSADQLNSCNTAKATRASLDAGVYHVDSSATRIRGLAALNYPDNLSQLSGAASGTFPAFPAYTFTNFQASQVNSVRGRTLGGTYTVTPPSVTLFFAEALRIIRLQSVTPAYFPLEINYEGAASRCDSDLFSVGFDDHVGEIEVPIFYIARQEANFYSTTVTGSGDVSKLVVNPALDPSLYGHADFFLANDAASKIWQPILGWIRAHR
jgi:pimeloyl-ACP methyl ester carboxylesterase